MAGGLLALLTKPKGASIDEEEAPAARGGVEQEFAREAFSALKDDDEEGFVSAFISAVKACARKANASGYEEEDDPY